MFPPFDESLALTQCRRMVKQLDCGELLLERVTKESEERRGQGVMLGAMVCLDGDGRRVALEACSGTSRALVRRGKASVGSPDKAAPFVGNPSETGDGISKTAGNLHEAAGNPSETADELEAVIVPNIVPTEAIEQALSANDAEIHFLTERLSDTSLSEAERSAIAAKRKSLTTKSLKNVHNLYKFQCFDGKTRSLAEICKQYNKGRLPPTGTGECSAPKLLDYALSHNLRPVSMAEVFYCKKPKSPPSEQTKPPSRAVSQSPNRAVSHSPSRAVSHPPCRAVSYPPCNERCGIILPAMLGLSILYRDSDIIVVNKQSNVLSVPGRGEDKQDCIASRVKALFSPSIPNIIEQPAVHRLDMETSGLMVLAFTREAHRALSKQFEAGEVKKRYTALLDGVLAKKGIANHGQMELYFRLDVDNRPHQIWDDVYGKKAITEWQIERVQDYAAPEGTKRPATRVTFTPHTGRTHQLRLASADSHGFGVPIIGDTLYGTCAEGERLMLHACHLAFAHPATGKTMEFDCPAEF